MILKIWKLVITICLFGSFGCAIVVTNWYQIDGDLVCRRALGLGHCACKVRGLLKHQTAPSHRHRTDIPGWGSRDPRCELNIPGSRQKGNTEEQNGTKLQVEDFTKILENFQGILRIFWGMLETIWKLVTLTKNYQKICNHIQCDIITYYKYSIYHHCKSINHGMNILAHSHTPNEETHRSQFGFHFGVYLLSLFPMCSLISLWSVWPFLVGPWSVSTTRIHISMVSINHKDAQAYGQYPPQGYTSLWSVSTTRIPKCMVSIHHKDTQAIHNQFFKAMVAAATAWKRGSQHILLESYRIATWELLFL